MGDDSAFEELVHRHGPRLRRQCARIVGPDDAEDAVQQALLSASRALRAGDDELDVGRWLHRVAHNAAIDALRRRPPPSVELDEQFDGVPQPPDVAAGRESLRATVAAIQQLPDAQRRALLLSVFEGNSWEEIARELGTGEGAVRGLLHRARTGMRTAVALVVFPFFLLKVHAARAATGGLPATTKAGLVVVVAGTAGGTAAVIATRGHHHHTPRAAPLVAEATPLDTTPTVTSKVNTLRITKKHHKKRTKPRATIRHHKAGRSHSRHTSIRQPSSGGTGPHAPATAPAPEATPTPSSPPPSVTEPSTTPAPAAETTPPPAETTTTPPPPDTTPSYPPAPATVARIDSWTGGSTNSPGTLHVIFDDGRNVTGYVTGDGTAITCDHVQNDRLTSSESCSMSSLAGGQRIVKATWSQVQNSTRYKFDTLEVVVSG